MPEKNYTLPAVYEDRGVIMPSVRVGRPVVRAYHTVLQEVHVLKFYTYNEDDQSIAFQEPQMMRALHHSNIVPIKNAEPIPGTRTVWIATELLPHGSLFDKLHSSRYWGIQEKCVLMCDVLRALTYLHVAMKLLHRDIKPANILLRRAERKKFHAVLTDFGSAATMDSDSTCSNSGGAKWYKAPELLGGARSTIQSEIYSAGLVFFELLMSRGFVPVDLEKKKVLFAVLTAGGRPIDPANLPFYIPPKLRGVVDIATRPDPKERYRSAAEFRTAIEKSIGFELKHIPRAGGQAWLISNKPPTKRRHDQFLIQTILGSGEKLEISVSYRNDSKAPFKKFGRVRKGPKIALTKAVHRAIKKMVCSPNQTERELKGLLRGV